MRIWLVCIVLGGISVPTYAVLHKLIDNDVYHVLIHYIYIRLLFPYVLVGCYCLMLLLRCGFHCQY